MLVQKRYDCSIGFRVLVLMIAGLFFFSFNHSRIVSADTNSGALPLQPIIDSAREEISSPWLREPIPVRSGWISE